LGRSATGATSRLGACTGHQQNIGARPPARESKPNRHFNNEIEIEHEHQHFKNRFPKQTDRHWEIHHNHTFPVVPRATRSLFIAEGLALLTPIRECGVPPQPWEYEPPPGEGDQAPAQVATPPAKTGNFNKAKSGKAISERRQAGQRRGRGIQSASPASPASVCGEVLWPAISSTLDALQPGGEAMVWDAVEMGRLAVAMMTGRAHDDRSMERESSNSRR